MNFPLLRCVSVVIFATVLGLSIDTVVVAWMPSVSSLCSLTNRRIDCCGSSWFRVSRIRPLHVRTHSLITVCFSGLSDENMPLGNNEEAEEWSDFTDLGYTPFDSSVNLNVSEKLILDPDDTVDVSSAAVDELKGIDFAMLLQEKQQTSVRGDTTSATTSRSVSNVDYTAIQTRQFLLGKDLVISDYVGTMGFQEVTDWEYYYPDEDGEDRRQVVQPNPFDSNT
jgi:hypothetical protein